MAIVAVVAGRSVSKWATEPVKDAQTGVCVCARAARRPANSRTGWCWEMLSGFRKHWKNIRWTNGEERMCDSTSMKPDQANLPRARSIFYLHSVAIWLVKVCACVYPMAEQQWEHNEWKQIYCIRVECWKVQAILEMLSTRAALNCG